MPTAAPAPPPATDTRYPRIEVALIEPSGLNPRTHWGDDKELQDSIRVDGVLEPIIVRPHAKKDGRYQIVAGERRFRAAYEVGLEEIPAIVREVSDEKLLELALTENIQRKNMHPLDEANGFIKRLEMGGCSPEALANSLGLSKRYITDRIRLTKLCKEGMAMLERGDMPVSHAILIARLDPKLQPDAIDDNADYAFDLGEGPKNEKDRRVMRSLADLKRWIGQNVPLDLKSESAQEEFPELAHEIAEAEAKGAAVTMLSDFYRSAKAKPGDPLSKNAWQECKKTDKAAQLGVIVEGNRRGDKVYWKPTPKPPAPSPATSPSLRTASPEEKKRHEARERREQAEERRRREAQQAWSKLREKAKTAFVNHIDALPLKKVLDIVAAERRMKHDGTAEGLLRAIAAKQHSYADHSLDSFSYGTKGTGFDVKAWFKKELAATKKAAPAKAKKAKKR